MNKNFFFKAPKELTKEFIINSLAGSDLYLTGSRFFGNATEKSDYDFFMDYDAEAARHLIELGSKVLGTDMFLDEYAYSSADINVIHHIECANGEVVQIQMLQVGYSAIKHEIQEFIFNKCRFIFNSLDKEGRKTVWTMMFQRGTDGDIQKFSPWPRAI